ncbi:MAG: nucleotide exchange factor GrpE [Thermanaeromonas sp.]|uniref:nucleotide exchange factor GrpE n=1 Tax=Thermanaeromonas sp. TaxID=2003697 RepID=UPI002438F664|nr:nucleotide exchange factor GrpE [Thermanaeromonas sp.]MCG0277565.1 nucleotide exchange factor GrpE [Thermanaeromonas sp.]
MKLEPEGKEVDQPTEAPEEVPVSSKEEAEGVPAGEVEEAPPEVKVEGEEVEGKEAEAERDVREQEIAALKEEVESLRSQLIRLHADFDNYRKRVRREQQEMKETATAGLIKELLPVLDNLELALAAAKTGGEKEAFVSGVEMVWRQLLEVLSREGLTPIEAVGRPFDPFQHEAVATEEASEAGQYNTVTAELRKGYLLKGKLLRPALVKVAVPPAPPPEASTEDKKEES